jgi:hypothetical protein
MADTRDTIKNVVELNIGRSNTVLENRLCDEALKIALLAHPFDDGTSQPSDFTITEDATSVDISGTSNILTIVTARIVQASGDLNAKLKLKNRTWWDEHVLNPEDNQKGWPVYGLHFGTNIVLDRPAESNLELRLRVTTDKVFDNDNTVCPIAVLDKFVIKYVTAQMFKQLKQFNAAKEWRKEALGPYFDTKGEPGGFLLAAINCDKANIAEEMEIDTVTDQGGVSILNEITGHGDNGNVRTWH